MTGDGHRLDSMALNTGALGAKEKTPRQYAQAQSSESRTGRVIVGETHESTVGSPKEQTIKLDPKISKRGGKVGKVFGERPERHRRRKGMTKWYGISENMGGRHQ